MIGLVTMVYEPLYHAREIETIKLSSGCSCKAKSARSGNISFYNKIIIPLALVADSSQLGARRLVDYLLSHIQRALVE